jgi:GNAT superfamily N-acetyltransferase
LPDLRIERLPITHPDADRLVEEVQQEYVARYGGRDDTPLDASVFEAPRGAFFVGYLDGVPVATGALRLRDDVPALGSTTTAEIKRMYVASAARRTGMARRMLAHLESTALGAGAPVIILETGTAQPEAIALYESSGYERIADFGYYKDAPLSRCFGRRLLAITDEAFDSADAAALRSAQRVELDARYGCDDHEPGTAPTAADVAHFLVARDASGAAVACGGLRLLGDGEAEIKRMYVVPQARGTGVAIAVLRALEQQARGLGLTGLVLETGTLQPEAIRFYEREGYSRIENFGPYVGSAISICFRRELDVRRR